MVISMNNIVGGGDSWIVNPASGLPDVRTLTTGVNTVTFTMPNTDFGYMPWIEVPDGLPTPTYKSMTANGTTLTVVTNEITAAQAANNGCKMKIRIIK